MSEETPHSPTMEPVTSTWPRLGAFSYGYMHGDVERLARDFRQVGLSAVQLAMPILDGLVEAPATIQATRAALGEAGITVAGLAAYRNLVAPDLDKRTANIEFMKRCLEIAPLLGTSVVATETGTRNAQSDWLDSPENVKGNAWDLLYAAIEELLPVAEAHGSVLALEGYVNNVLRTQEQVLGLLEQFPTRHLGLVLDPFNYLSRELLADKERVVAEFLERFEHRFVLAHLKDVSADGAEVDTPEFGHGVFPHLMYLRFLKTRRPDLPIILEHLPFDHIPDAIARFHAYLDAAE